MPIKIDAQRKKNLTAAMQPIVEAATVQSGQFINPGLKAPLDGLNALLPQSGPVRDRLRNYISDEPMYDFVYGQLSSDLAKNKFDALDQRRLVEVEGFEDSTAVSTRLVDLLDALPNRYVLSMRLPHPMDAIFEEGEVSIEVAPGVTVRKSSAMTGVYPTVAPETSLLASLLQAPPGWQAEAAYLQVEFDGFVGRFVTSESHAEAMEIMFAFVGAAIAFRTLKLQQSWSMAENPWGMSVHQRVDDAWVHLESNDIDSTRGRLLRRLVFDDHEKRLKAHHEKMWLRRCVTRIGVLLRAPDKSRSRIMLGCKWLFDSYCGDDQLLKYIQAAVVVETLLGDKSSSDQVGLGVLLGNRCAYLIGHTSTQRDELLADFKRIYDVRSRILHRGKSRLTDKDAELLSQLYWICSRIIQVECDLLMRDQGVEDPLA